MNHVMAFILRLAGTRCYMRWSPDMGCAIAAAAQLYGAADELDGDHGATVFS